MLKPESVSKSEVLGTCFDIKLPLEGAIASRNVESFYVNVLIQCLLSFTQQETRFLDNDF